MAYNQYSSYAFTGAVESAINRVANNAADTTHAEDISFPDKFDIFVNKENASVGGFAVTEAHASDDLVGSKLYLDHKIFIDATGGFETPTTSDGTLDATTVDLFASSIEFSTLPSATTYNISYNANSDKIQDSHLNVAQNVLMQVQKIMGLRNSVGGVGTGIATLPLVTQYAPPDQAALDDIKATVLTNIILVGDLEADYKIGSTENSALDSYGSPGYTIQVGNGGLGAQDQIRINTDQLRVNDSVEGNLQYSMQTGDAVFFSGSTVFASQVTIGEPHAGKGAYQGVLPADFSGFYADAMLRVNGPIYFGDGISGNGSIVFVTQTGEKVDIEGDLEATDLNVENTSTFNGVSTFKGKADAVYPGYFTTNAEITLTDRGGQPTVIDGLDPSYAQVVTESDAQVDGTVSTYLWDPTFNNDHAPYISGAKAHPVHGFDMYPIIGGWTHTGLVKFAKAAFHSHQQVLLLEADLTAVTGFNEYVGTYAPGWFNPGDTFVEIDDGGTAKVAYPIYFHEVDDAPGDTITGLNVWIAADDDIHESPSIINQNYRIFQPGNAPVHHLTSSFATPTAPTASIGNAAGGYYSDGNEKNVEFRTSPAFPGPSVGNNPYALHKRMTDNTTVNTSILQALQRNIDYTQITNGGGWGAGDHPGGTEVGTAYIFATSDVNADNTRHNSVKLKASPSPFGIATNAIWSAGIKLNPGQWALVGEVVASTTNGTSWTEVETVGYRPNAFYDSCWIPMVNYRDSSMVDLVNQAVDRDIGRCLPIHGSSEGTTSETQFSVGEGNHNFYVEHNIGPIRSLTEVSIRIWIASYPDSGYDSALDGGWKSFYRMTAEGVTNLWSPFSMPYNINHDLTRPAVGPSDPNKAGFLREITPECRIRMFDPRFCRISIDTSATPLQDVAGGNSEYIRVVIKRTR